MAAPAGARRRGVVSEVAGRKFKPLTDPSPLSRTPVSPLNLYRTWSRVQNGPLKFLSAELHIVESMHARKAMMTDLSSAFVALPGGLGTLEETFEVLTWSQLGMHSKPVGLLNVAGYYDGLIEFLDRAVTERFLKPEHRELLLIEERAGALLSAFSRYRAVKIGKWIERTET